MLNGPWRAQSGVANISNSEKERRKDLYFQSIFYSLRTIPKHFTANKVPSEMKETQQPIYTQQGFKVLMSALDPKH